MRDILDDREHKAKYVIMNHHRFFTETERLWKLKYPSVPMP